MSVDDVVNKWDQYWVEGNSGDYWSTPDAGVIDLVQNLDRSRVRDVLDLGCGVGRHALYLAAAGFSVVAVDSSPEALARARRESANRGVVIETVQADYCQDVFRAESFDFALAFNTVYHGSRERMAAAI